MSDPKDGKPRFPTKPFSSESTSTGTATVGDHTQIVDLKAATRAGGQILPLVQVTAGADQGRIFSLSQNSRMTIGRSKDSSLVVYEPSCSRNHAEIFLAPDGTAWIKDLGSTNGTKVNADRVSAPRPLVDGDRIQIGDTTVLRFSLIPEDDARAQMDVYHRATRDALTGAYNRRQFDEFMSREMAFLKRNENQGLGVIIFDVDHFKKTNDSFGHLAGDEVLRELGRRVPGLLRAEDFFARIGGEEFIVLSRSENLEGVSVVAERIRQAMESAPASFEGRGIIFTVSVGYTFVRGRNDIALDHLLATADACLYEAKNGGRNRVVGRPPAEVKT